MNAYRNVNPVNSLLVSAYKLFGFAALTAILIGLSSYIAVNIFYFIGRSWVAPLVLSPTDQKVLDLSTQFAQQATLREKLVAERSDLVVRAEDFRRQRAMQEGFQHRFMPAVKGEQAGRVADLAELRTLVAQSRATRGEIDRAGEAYRDLSWKRLRELWAAHLITREEFVTGSFQLSQIEHSKLSLAQDEGTLTTRAAALERELRSLAGIGRGAPGTKAEIAQSFDVLRAEQEYAKSLVDGARAKDTRESVLEAIEGIDKGIARYDRILKTIQESPYIKATEHNLTVAFVPYANVENIRKGAALYGCRLELLVCQRIGQVVEPLVGEVMGNHPISNHQMRGMLVQIELTDNHWAEKRVIYVGRPPLWL